MPVLEGHREGAQTLKRTVKDAVRAGPRELCVYAFSTENWSRPADEVEGLMAMFAELIISETPELDEEGVRMRFIGRREGVSRRAPGADGLGRGDDRPQRAPATLFVAFNYGGRAEILDAAERYAGGGEEAFAAGLYAPEMGDPDLVIRTSGESRLSNFLLWQTAYSELVVRRRAVARLHASSTCRKRCASSRCDSAVSAPDRFAPMESSGGRGGSERSRAFDFDLNVELEFDRIGREGERAPGELETRSLRQRDPRRGARRPSSLAAAARQRPCARKRRRRRGSAAETLARILWAIPWIVVAVTIVVLGGLTFAGAMVVFSPASASRSCFA